MDKISMLVGRHAFSARVFHNGAFRGEAEFREDGHVGYLHVIREGSVLFRHDDDSSLVIATPCLLFYPRGSNHRLGVPSEAPATLLSASTSFQGGGQNLLAKALPDYMLVPLDQEQILNQTIELLFSEAAIRQGGQELILDRVCEVLIIQMLRHYLAAGRLSPGTLAGLTDTRLSRALSAIHALPQKPWRLESLASLCGMSRSKFAEYFLLVIGITPGEYLTQLRIEAAQSLLKKGRTIKIVSAEVGYSSQSAFTRAFTERMGMSPRAWLHQHAGRTLQADSEAIA
jgi:AraC-like DNA-binding protein